MVKTKVLAIIKDAVASGKGIRTTELRRAYERNTGKFPEIGSDQEVLLQLKDDGKIKFLTEPWNDYCWLVPANHERSPSNQRNEIDMRECDLFF